MLTRKSASAPVPAPGIWRSLLIATFAITGWVPSTYAATSVPIVGEIERITINDPTDHWSGGTIQVAGQIVTLPRNLLLDLPANRLTLKQLYDQAPLTCIAAAQTGLAKADTCNRSGTGGFASISANRTNAGNTVAGDVLIQKGTELVSGVVSYVDYSDGYYRLNGIVGDPTTGVMVRLNDPTSRHTVQQGLGCAGGPNCSADPRFTLDPDNYTNVFSTGYPVCIPSTVSRTFVDSLELGVTTAQANLDGTGDVLCPQANRPAPPVPPAVALTPVADSRRFAPVKIGDSITAEGNFETVNGVRFLSAHTTMVRVALATDPTPGSNQPDYIFLDEVEIDAPGWENQRIRTLIIGYATQQPADVMVWSIHRNPVNNGVHEFPLATTVGCDRAGGVGTCTRQGLLANGTDIFKIRHDVDFLVGADGRLNPCAQLINDPRFINDPLVTTAFCPGGAFSTVQMMGILSPIPHEIQARTGKKYASLQTSGTPLLSIDVNGNEATNGQYLFPFGINLGGIAFAEQNEIDLNALNKAYAFSGIPWNLDRRLSPGGCLDTTGPTGAPDGIPDCETTPQPLEPFPFEGYDPRTQALTPSGAYNDANFTASLLSDSKNRILSYVDPTLVRPGGNGVEFPASGNFNGDLTLLAWPPADPAAFSIAPTNPVNLACTADTGGNTAPVAVADSASTPAGVAVTIPVLANDTDADGNALTVTAVTQPAAGTGTVAINADNTTVTYNPGAFAGGTATFTYTVSDGTATAVGTVTVTVIPAGNVAPVAVNDVAATTEDSAGVTIAVLANDTDANGNALTVTAVTQPALGGSVATNGTTVSFTPSLNFNGTASFTYTISDGQGGTASASVAVTVTPVNDAPVANPDTARVVSGANVTIAVLANDTDVDGNALLVAAVTQPANGSVVLNLDNTVRYTPNGGFSGLDTFTYTISDGAGGTAIGNVTVNVDPAITDTVAVNRAQFSTRTNNWTVTGTGSVSGNTVTIHFGPTLGGAVIGSATVDVAGNWAFRQASSIVAAPGDTISIESNGGGTVTAFPVDVR